MGDGCVCICVYIRADIFLKCDKCELVDVVCYILKIGC